MQTVSIVASLLVATAFLMQAGCGSGDGDAPTAAADSSSQSVVGHTTAGGAVADRGPGPVAASSDATAAEPVALPKANMHPEVIISTDVGEIRVRLDAENAPLTTENFLSNYVYRDFYPGTIFHYVEKDFMVAAGGYTADLKPKETRAYLKSEADNGLQNKRGTIAMTRLPDHPDSATSQFFINLVDNPELDHKDDKKPEDIGYCVFGEIVEGMDVADKIAELPVTDKEAFHNTPVEPIAIRSVKLVR